MLSIVHSNFEKYLTVNHFHKSIVASMIWTWT